MSTSRLVIAALAFATAACTDTNSATNLHPDGPPKVEQVRVGERYTDSGGDVHTRRVFAFGTHPQATADDEHPVTSALANDQHLRIIMDQLLAGNRLEEIQCRGSVGPDGEYGKVPDGATPDDIALCSVAADVLPASCKGAHAVCICDLDGGCFDDAGNMIAKGKPVGVKDINQDGASDDTKMIAGVVGMKCGSVNVPIDLQKSYWQPSGFQQPPAVTGGPQAGFELLGPAIVLVPDVSPATSVAKVPGAMPTNTMCSLTFDSSVTNKRGEQVCAPAEGNPDAPCSALDLSQVSFKVEPLQFVPNSFTDGAPIANTDDLQLFVNAALTDASMANMTLTRNATAVTGFTFDLVGAAAPQALILNIHPPGGTWPAGMYTLTFPTTVVDAFGQPPPAPIVFHFTV